MKESHFSQQQWLPFYNLRKIGNTTLFQGNNKRKKYFEGWYFKMVAKDASSIFSVIPGISLSADGKKQHAFIQLINGLTAQTSYYSFPIEEFRFAVSGFAISIGHNYFSKEKLILDLKDQDSVVSGKIEMSNLVEYTSGRLMNYGIMGWYRFVPFMECYHGVLSLTHDLKGQLHVNDQVYHFDGGKGYIEKDWGSSMPSAWIWMQSNNFSKSDSSFMLSIANIPWLGKSFTGYLGYFYHDHKIHHFATYRPTSLDLEIDQTDKLKITLKNKQFTFVVHARSLNTGILKAPTEGSMNRRIPESIDAVLEISMLDQRGNLIFSDSSTITGLEMVGEYRKLQGFIK